METPGWDESMETGDPAIDRQHREIIGLVDELGAAESVSHATRDVRYHVLARLMDFTVAHFAMEEDLMRRVEYPPAPTKQMIEQHQEFTAYARLRVLEFRSGELASVLPLQAFLRVWLVDHEFGLDRTLVEWIHERSTGSGASS